MAMELPQSAARPQDGEVHSCVSKLIHAFTDGLNIFKRLRERRRRRKKSRKREQGDGASNAELQLSNSLRRGPRDIQESYENHYGKVGDRFAKGDAIAHASLAETLIKLNTGLVGIIATFLNHDTKHSHLNLDYKSLTDLSEASRIEAVNSLNQLYQRLSQSQLQVHRIGGCPRCGSMKHQTCSGNISAKSDGEKKRSTGSRTRSTGPMIARVPVKSSNQTQLVVMRPKNTRKGSSSSSSSSSSKSHSTTPSPPYASPITSPLPQYSPIDPWPAAKTPMPRENPPLPPPSSRRRAGSFDGPRPTTWPLVLPENALAPPAMNLRLPPVPPKPRQLQAPRKSPSPRASKPTSPSPPAVPMSPVKRRIDKATPSTYTFASDSTKLGEIPQRNWTTPWNYEEAERLNAEAAASGYPLPPAAEGRPRAKKGLFGFLRRGSAQAA